MARQRAEPKNDFTEAEIWSTIHPLNEKNLIALIDDNEVIS
jgi:hypothetical protein